MNLLSANLTAGSRTPLRNLAAQAASRITRIKAGIRLAIVAKSHEDLAAKLSAAKDALASGKTKHSDKSGIYIAPVVSEAPKVAFLYPGQGSQFPNMLRDLAVHFPEFRLTLEHADRVLAGRFPKKLSTFIYPQPVFSPEEEKQQMAAITATAVAQPALGAVEIALTRLLKRLGIEPSMTAGHSYGEYVALAAAGVIDEEALFELSERRGNAIEEATRGGDAGTMAAVLAEAHDVERALNGSSGVTIANYNSPKQTIIAGPKDAIAAAISKLGEQKLAAKPIAVACAFHSPLMQPARERLAAVLDQQSYAAPHAQVFSNTLAAPYPEDSAAIAGLLASHLVKPVLFVDQLRAMHDAGARVFVEVGPKNVLSNLAKQNLEGRDVSVLQTDAAGVPGLEQLLHLLGQLATLGVPVDAEELFRGRVTSETVVTRDPQWLVNGAGTFARATPPLPKTPIKLVDPASIPPVIRTVEVVKEVVKEVPVPVAGAPAPMAAAAPGAGNVVVEYQRMMQQFLSSQTAIMQSFLTGGGAPAVSFPAPPPGVHTNVAQSAFVPAAVSRVAAQPVPVASSPIPAAPAIAAPSSAQAPTAPASVVLTPAARNLEKELVAIVSERTGYPSDMLDLEAAIEADLGIDSIKRVEILSAFQRTCHESEQKQVQALMEKLTSARTLREIASRLAPLFASVAQFPAATASKAEPARVTTPVRSILPELVAIVSDRTGYPPDMLDVTAAIEADLGIDSIKRVEILSAFQRTCTETEQANVQSIMERLTAARTLAEIAERLAPLFSEGSVVGAFPSLAKPAPVVGRKVLADLIAIVSDRTGYPPAMLDPQAAIEADLGIDSIKRVEILSAFQRTCSEEEQASVQAMMERLTGARTLAEIGDRLAPLFQSPPSMSNVPSPQPPIPRQAQSNPARNILAELIAIVSDRTGYPTDMLDANAAIEADLGIDSIKRVEILSAFQRSCSESEQANVQSIMERLTSARTLNEIAERLGPLFSGGTSPFPPPSPSASPAGPVVPARDLLAELTSIVSDRTGYPADMLDPQAAIEADLGIDSIKRVEILSAFQRTCSEMEQSSVQSIMERLTSARTLHEIADRLALVLAANPRSADAALIPLQPAPVESVARFTLTTVARSRSSAPLNFPGRVALITDDENGIASALAESWKTAGERVLLLRHSPGSTLQAEGVYSTDLTDPSQIEAMFDAVRKEYGSIGAVVHLLPLQTSPLFSQLTFAEWRAEVRQDIRSLYLLAKYAESDLKSAGKQNGALFAVVTGRGGEFGLTPGGTHAPVHFAVADFVKTLSLEFNDVLCKVVDIDPSDPVAILRQKLIEELACREDVLQIGLPGDRRLTVVPRRAPLPASPLSDLNSESVVLLTGGARGITAGIARTLAQRTRPKLILAGASPLPPPEPQETAAIREPAQLKAALLQRLRASGKKSVKPADVESAYSRLMKNREIQQNLVDLSRVASHVEYHEIDVRDESRFGALIDGIYQRFGRLDVVIHGAGVIEDRLIKDKTPESFDRVVHTKTDSTFVLTRKLRPSDTKHLILMSSITAAFGNRGQADYAAANGAMNGIATMLAAEWPGHVVAMNWGPWDQGGMVSDDVRRQFLAQGIELIPPAAGDEAVMRELALKAQDKPIAVFGEGPWGKLALRPSEELRAAQTSV